MDQARIQKGMLLVPVENRYHFTNLNKLKIRWTREDGGEGICVADVPPQENGFIQIPETEKKLQLQIHLFERDQSTADRHGLHLSRKLGCNGLAAEGAVVDLPG
ncbi:MAG: beta-galactosidase domain 4-containing protein [Planctomycetota bacterium]